MERIVQINGLRLADEENGPAAANFLRGRPSKLPQYRQRITDLSLRAHPMLNSVNAG
jgi:hypothetical protein